MPTRNINLTEHYDSFLARTIESGRYKNVSEIVRAGLRLLEQQQQEDAAKLEALRRDVSAGEEAYQRGEFVAVSNDTELDRLFDEITVEAQKA